MIEDVPANPEARRSKFPSAQSAFERHIARAQATDNFEVADASHTGIAQVYTEGETRQKLIGFRPVIYFPSDLSQLDAISKQRFDL